MPAGGIYLAHPAGDMGNGGDQVAEQVPPLPRFGREEKPTVPQSLRQLRPVSGQKICGGHFLMGHPVRVCPGHDEAPPLACLIPHQAPQPKRRSDPLRRFARKDGFTPRWHPLRGSGLEKSLCLPLEPPHQRPLRVACRFGDRRSFGVRLPILVFLQTIGGQRLQGLRGVIFKRRHHDTLRRSVARKAHPRSGAAWAARQASAALWASSEADQTGTQRGL